MAKEEPTKLEELEAVLTPRSHGFPPHINAELQKPLNPAYVASRSQNGHNLSYIEAWRAIEEMNRIFGFGGWTREVVEMREVQSEQKKNSSGKELWYVGYTCRVRVTILGALEATYREGCGFGQGIDADCGRAHESAVKEAESDSYKRAVMTFGYPLGLALYDKTQANVGDDAPKAVATDAETVKRYKEIVQLLEPTKTWLDAFIARNNNPKGSYGKLMVMCYDEHLCRTTDDIDALVETGLKVNA
jgi:DNA recombination protein Rad52